MKNKMIRMKKTISDQKRPGKTPGISHNMKGIALPLNMIVIIAIGVLAIAAMGAFLLSGSLSGITSAEAQRVFSSGCARYCSSDLFGTLHNAYQASKNDPNFVNACVKLGYIEANEKTLMNRCLSKCGNCNLEVGTEDISGNYDNLIAKTTRG